MNRNRKTILILSTAVFAAVALVRFGAMAGYQQRVSNEEVEPQSEIIDIYPSSGMEVELSISNAPALNETAELTCVVTSVRDAKNSTVRIELPEGFILVSGDFTWAGDIIVPEEEKLKHPRPPSDCSGPECNRLWREYEYPKGRVEFSAVVKAVKVGHWNISARARGEGIPGGGIDRIYISVFEDKATVSDSPPKNNWISGGGGGGAVNGDKISANLSLSALPMLNKEVDLVFMVTPLVDLSDARINLAIPRKGMEIVEIKPASKPSIPSEFSHPSGLDVSGHGLSWRGDIAKNETIRIEAVVKSLVTGKGNIVGSVYVARDDGTIQIYKPVVLEIAVTEWSATVNTIYPPEIDMPPRKPLPEKTKYGEPYIHEEPIKRHARPVEFSSDEVPVNLSLSASPVLNKEVSLVFTVTPSVDLSNAAIGMIWPEKGLEIVEIKLPSKPSTSTELVTMHPSGLNVLERQLCWKGAIAKNETVRLEVVVKPTVTEKVSVGGLICTARDGVKVKEKEVVLDISVAEGTATVNTSSSILEKEGGEIEK